MAENARQILVPNGQRKRLAFVAETLSELKKMSPGPECAFLNNFLDMAKQEALLLANGKTLAPRTQRQFETHD